MSSYFAYTFAGLLGYLLGSLPFAVLIAKSKGVDIFKVGSGNPGATNVLRNLGKPAGYLCFALDALKGAIAVLVSVDSLPRFFSAADPAVLGVVALVAAILGHSFSCFLRFRGGKGVATTVGGLLALMPWVMLAGVLVWLGVFFWKKYVSLASLALGAALPLAAYLQQITGRPSAGVTSLHVYLCLALCVLILVRHLPNIRRLLNGTENRAGAKKPTVG